MRILKTILGSFWAGLFRRRERDLREIFPGVEWRAAPIVPPIPQKPPPYSVFTREFDRVVDAADLGAFLGIAPRLVDHGDDDHKKFQAELDSWRLDCAMTAFHSATDIRAVVSPAILADTAVAFLVDQSGSMRGRPVILTAATLDVAQDFLAQLGCAVEVLGFTTVTWRGGRARGKWLREGKPPRPGRLCELLHIVYRQAHDRPHAPADWNIKAMLHPGLLKENVDGEALEWAAARLRALPYGRKILIVVSDGAPVDDSTLAANDAGILHRHLRQVIADLESADDLAVAAVGIGYSVAEYYKHAVMVRRPDDLGETLIGLLQSALTGDPEATRSPPAAPVTIH